MNGGFGMFFYKKATLQELDKIWERNIAENPGDDRYLRWRDRFLDRNRKQQAATFVILDGTEPVGEVTLDYYAAGYGNPQTRSRLADGDQMAYVTALRIQSEYEGQGHVSRLMACMEEEARHIGFTRLSIGVEAAESRNLAIYLHWGYDQFLLAEEDGDQLVLFYAKNL